jgi:hypothetical protein
MHLEIRDIVPLCPISPNWSLPCLPRGVEHASLTNLLPNIPEIERALLPNARRAVTEINRALRQRPFIAPSHTTQALKAHWRVGLAIDRGALFLSGVDVVSRPLQRLARSGAKAKALGRLLKAWEPKAKGMFRNRAAVGWLYVLGALDSALRGFVPLSDVIMHDLPKRVDAATAKAWLYEAVPVPIAAEIVLLLRSLREIRIRGPISANPVFGGIGPIAGSDGDWIVADTLVELKCVVDGVKRRNVAQLISYYALSQLPDRQHRLPPFSRLAICLPRQSATVVGTIDEWLRAFGAPTASRVVEAWHNCFDPRGLAKEWGLPG